MKKMIVLVSMMVVSMSFFAGCDAKGKKCGKLYDKMTTCFKELGDDDKMGKGLLGEGKDKFVAECKKADEAKKMLDCLDKSACPDFLKCAFGIDLVEMKKAADEAKKMMDMAPGADMPADAPAADMPAEAPAADMPAEAPAADMPAEPAADMPADM